MWRNVNVPILPKTTLCIVCEVQNDTTQILHFWKTIFCDHATDLSDGLDETLMAYFLFSVCPHMLDIL